MATTHLMLRALRTKNPSTLVKAYTVYIRPILDFGTTVYSPHLKKDIASIDRVQNFFTRKVFLRCYNYDYSNLPPPTERNSTLNLDDLSYRRRQNDLKYLLKFVYGRISLSTKVRHHYNIRPSRMRGQGFALNFPSPSTNLRKNSFFIRSAIYFNKKSREGPMHIDNIASD